MNSNRTPELKACFIRVFCCIDFDIPRKMLDGGK